jgi:hypothetical protein
MNKSFLPLILATSLLGACASAPDHAAMEQRKNCRNVEPRIGSNIVRPVDCAAAQEAKRSQETSMSAESK